MDKMTITLEGLIAEIDRNVDYGTVQANYEKLKKVCLGLGLSSYTLNLLITYSKDRAKFRNRDHADRRFFATDTYTVPFHAQSQKEEIIVITEDDSLKNTDNSKNTDNPKQTAKSSWLENVFTLVICSFVIISIFFNLIVPWTTSSVWPKVSFGLTCFSLYTIKTWLNKKTPKEQETAWFLGSFVLLVTSTIITLLCKF